MSLSTPLMEAAAEAAPALPARAQSQGLFAQASSSHQLLRSMTSNLGGAITASVPPSPAAPLRRAPTTQRLQNRQAHDEVLNEQVMVRFGLILCLTGLLALIISFAALICGLLAVRAAAQYGDKPCDAPLKIYTYSCFTLTMVKGQIIQRLSQVFLRGREPADSQWRTELAVFLVDLPFTAILVGAGVRFLWMAKTCPMTNPMLYYPVRRYVCMYIVSLSVGYAFGSGLLLLLRRVLRSGLVRSAGSCSKAVQSLPAVRFDPAEMRDTDDGTIIECVICQEEFSASKDIIRTGCGHLFHRECLAKWCAGHVSCPLCRVDIAEPD